MVFCKKSTSLLFSLELVNCVTAFRAICHKTSSMTDQRDPLWWAGWIIILRSSLRIELAGWHVFDDSMPPLHHQIFEGILCAVKLPRSNWKRPRFLLRECLIITSRKGILSGWSISFALVSRFRRASGKGYQPASRYLHRTRGIALQLNGLIGSTGYRSCWIFC